MAIAHQGTHSITPKLVSGGSSGWIVGYAVLAAFVIAASVYLAFYGQGVTQLDPSQVIGP